MRGKHRKQVIQDVQGAIPVCFKNALVLAKKRRKSEPDISQRTPDIVELRQNFCNATNWHIRFGCTILVLGRKYPRLFSCARVPLAAETRPGLGSLIKK